MASSEEDSDMEDWIAELEGSMTPSKPVSKPVSKPIEEEEEEDSDDEGWVDCVLTDDEEPAPFVPPQSPKYYPIREVKLGPGCRTYIYVAKPEYYEGMTQEKRIQNSQILLCQLVAQTQSIQHWEIKQ